MASTPSIEYWRERAELRVAGYKSDSYETLRVIQNAYRKALEGIRADIDNIYDWYSRRNLIDLKDAVNILKQPVSDEEYKSLLAQIATVENPRIKRELIARINAPAYRYRMTRLERLQESIHAQVMRLADVEIREAGTLFRRNIYDAYGRTLFDMQRGIGYGFSVDQISTATAEQILRTPWSGVHYSERIWKNSHALSEWLQEDLLGGMLQGKSMDHLADSLSENLGVGWNEAKRLVETESAYVTGQAELEGYRSARIEKYRYLAEKGEGVCERCRELDEKVIPVADAKPGYNLQPMHPRCHCDTAAYFEDMDIEELVRQARDPANWDVIEIPEELAYPEWQKLFMKNEEQRETPPKPKSKKQKKKQSLPDAGSDFFMPF